MKTAAKGKCRFCVAPARRVCRQPVADMACDQATHAVTVGLHDWASCLSATLWLAGGHGGFCCRGGWGVQGCGLHAAKNSGCGGMFLEDLGTVPRCSHVVGFNAGGLGFEWVGRLPQFLASRMPGG